MIRSQSAAVTSLIWRVIAESEDLHQTLAGLASALTENEQRALRERVSAISDRAVSLLSILDVPSSWN